MQYHDPSLSDELARLRGELDRLAARFSHEYGGSDEAAQRAEQLAAALQRLEWALSRQPRMTMSAVAGG